MPIRTPIRAYKTLETTDDLGGNKDRVRVEVAATQDVLLITGTKIFGGVVIDVTTMRVESGAMPDRFCWQLFDGRYCAIDDEPLAQSVLNFKGGLGFDRQGQMIEVRASAVTFLLRGRCESDTATPGIISFLPSVILLPFCCSGPRVVMGSLNG